MRDDSQPKSLPSVCLYRILCCLTLFCLACPSTAPLREQEDPESPEGDPRRAAFLPYEDDEGQLVLRGETSGLQPGDLVELVHIGPWPTGELSRPGQAIAQVTSLDDQQARAVYIGQRYSQLDTPSLVGRHARQPHLSLSKSLSQIEWRARESVRIGVGMQQGVSRGDFFFVLDQPTMEPERLGSRIVALIRVAEVEPDNATATIIHEMEPVQRGQTVIFAQHIGPYSKERDVSILFAQTSPQAEHQPGELPILAEALAEYQAVFRFANVHIESLPQHIDPALNDATDRARAVAPEEGFGVIVFGHLREEDFLYNITTYGSIPGPVTSVGILPGGLPMEMPAGFEALSEQLAPSFLATALTLRGEHAQAIYLIEYCLRNRIVDGSVAFHLREHLALRYASIGRSQEGLWLMSQDIRRARELNDPYLELNALSIREFLYQSRGNLELALEDSETFLERAVEVLPADSLFYEHLNRVRILMRLSRYQEALATLDQAIHQAQRLDELDKEVSARLLRASIISRQGDSRQAMESVLELLSNARLLGGAYPREAYVELTLSSLPLRSWDTTNAHLQNAIEAAETRDDRYSLAAIYEMGANLAYGFDQLFEAWQLLNEAVRHYGELDQFDDLARALLQLGGLEVSLGRELMDNRFFMLGLAHLRLSAGLSLATGDGYRASQAYGGMGIINSYLFDEQQALEHLGRCIDLAHDYNDPATVALIYVHVAQVQRNLGDLEQSNFALESARLWASTFGYDDILAQVEEIRRTMWSDI